MIYPDMLILCHCILNVNSRAPGIARWEGVIQPLWDIMKSRNLEFIQLPCPEAVYLGLRRWWFVKEQYDNPLYNQLCRNMALAVSKILLEKGVDKIRLIGLGISPSCGYREVQSDPSWGGRPREVDTTRNLKLGKGVLIENMENIFRTFNFQYEVYDIPPAVIYPDERAGVQSYPKSFQDSIKEICDVLQYDQRFLSLNQSRKEVYTDIRSGKILIAPYESFSEHPNLIEEYVKQRFGLILIPDSWETSYETELLADMYAKQVENHLMVEHEVSMYLPSEFSTLFGRFIEVIKMRNLMNKIRIV